MTESDALGPSVWGVSDGRAGNAAQVRAIMRALGDTQRWIKIAHIQGKGHRSDPMVLTPRVPWTWLPADKWPVPFRSLPKSQRNLLRPPWPTLWIAAGRRSAALTRAVREQSGGKTFTVQILDPRIAPDNFDLLVTPEHDDVDGDNVIRTIGSPSYFSNDQIEDAAQAFADLADERQKVPSLSWEVIRAPTRLPKQRAPGLTPSCGRWPVPDGACASRLPAERQRHSLHDSGQWRMKSGPGSGQAPETAKTRISPGSSFPMSRS